MGWLNDLHVVAKEIGPLRADIKALRGDLAVLGPKVDRLIELLTPIPSQPGPFSISVTGQVATTGGKTMLKFALVNIPAVDMTDPNNKDVVSRTMVVTIAGGIPVTADIPGLGAVDQLDNDGFVGNDGDEVTASLTYADAKGNQSTPRTETVILADNIAPAQPGDFGVKVTSQV